MEHKAVGGGLAHADEIRHARNVVLHVAEISPERLIRVELLGIETLSEALYRVEHGVTALIVDSVSREEVKEMHLVTEIEVGRCDRVHLAKQVFLPRLRRRRGKLSWGLIHHVVKLEAGWSVGLYSVGLYLGISHVIDGSLGHLSPVLLGAEHVDTGDIEISVIWHVSARRAYLSVNVVLSHKVTAELKIVRVAPVTNGGKISIFHLLFHKSIEAVTQLFVVTLVFVEHVYLLVKVLAVTLFEILTHVAATRHHVGRIAWLVHPNTHNCVAEIALEALPHLSVGVFYVMLDGFLAEHVQGVGIHIFGVAPLAVGTDDSLVALKLGSLYGLYV